MGRLRRGYILILIFIAIILALVGTTFFLPPDPGDPGLPGNNSDLIPETESRVQTATLAAVDDIIGHLTQVEQARTAAAYGSVFYDFSPSNAGFDFRHYQ